MDGIDIFARLLGACYLAGAFLTLRAIATDAMLDKALTALTLGEADAADQDRRRLLTALSLLTAASGGALLLLAGIAPWLFLLNLAGQAGWLVYARKRFPPQDDDEALGRRRSTNAAVVWTAATAIVIWLDFAGRLGRVTDPWPPAILAAAVAAMLAWMLGHLRWTPTPPEPFDHGDDSEGEPIVHPVRVRLALRYGYQTLWDADDGRALNPYDHLDPELATRLLVWEDAFHLAVDPEAPDAGPQFTEEQAASHAAEGLAIAAELAAVFGAGHVEGPAAMPTEAADRAGT